MAAGPADFRAGASGLLPYDMPGPGRARSELAPDLCGHSVTEVGGVVVTGRHAGLPEVILDVDAVIEFVQRRDAAGACPLSCSSLIMVMMAMANRRTS
jgi:hypothetical protein